MSAFQHLPLGAFVGNGFNYPARKRKTPVLIWIACLTTGAILTVLLYKLVIGYHQLSDDTQVVRETQKGMAGHFDELDQKIYDTRQRLSAVAAKLDGLIAGEKVLVVRRDNATTGEPTKPLREPEAAHPLVHRATSAATIRFADRTRYKGKAPDRKSAGVTLLKDHPSPSSSIIDQAIRMRRSVALDLRAYNRHD